MQSYIVQLFQCFLTGFLFHPLCLLQHIPESIDEHIGQGLQIPLHLGGAIMADIDLIHHIPQVLHHIHGVDGIADFDIISAFVGAVLSLAIIIPGIFLVIILSLVIVPVILLAILPVIP